MACFVCAVLSCCGPFRRRKNTVKPKCLAKGVQVELLAGNMPSDVTSHVPSPSNDTKPAWSSVKKQVSISNMVQNVSTGCDVMMTSSREQDVTSRGQDLKSSSSRVEDNTVLRKVVKETWTERRRSTHGRRGSNISCEQYASATTVSIET